MRQALRFGLVALATITLLAACGDDGGTDQGMGGDQDTGDIGEIRVWHLAEGAGAVDVFINGEAALEGFAFEQNTDFLPFDAGAYDIAVAPAGMGIEAAVIEVDGFALGAGEQWTIIASQLNADAGADGAFGVIPIEETADPADGEIAFRIFHAAYDVPGAVDVHNASDPNLTEIATGLAQGSVNAAAVVVPSAAYRIALDVDDDGAIDVVTEGAIDQPANPTRVIVGAISKSGEEPGEVETEIVWLSGTGENIHEEVELAAAELGEIRFWHLADAAGEVDIFVDGVAVATGVGFEQNTDFTPFLAGSYDIAVAPAGMGVDMAVIEVSDFALAEGDAFTVIAAQLNADPAAAGAFTALPVAENRGAPVAGIFYNAFHAAYAVPESVDLHVVDGDTNPELLAGIAQGAAGSEILDVANEAYTFGLDVGSEGTIDLQAGAALGPFAAAVTSVTVGAISKAEGEEVETEIVYLPGTGANIHEEVELEPFVD